MNKRAAVVWRNHPGTLLPCAIQTHPSPYSHSLNHVSVLVGPPPVPVPTGRQVAGDEYTFYDAAALEAAASSNNWAGASHWKFPARKLRVRQE